MVQRKASLKSAVLAEAENWTYRGEGKTGLVVTNSNGLVIAIFIFLFLIMTYHSNFNTIIFQAVKLRKGDPESDYLYVFKRNCRFVEICIAPIFGNFLCYGQV